jgi:hypothetical protein
MINNRFNPILIFLATSCFTLLSTVIIESILTRNSIALIIGSYTLGLDFNYLFVILILSLTLATIFFLLSYLLDKDKYYGLAYKRLFYGRNKVVGILSSIPWQADEEGDSLHSWTDIHYDTWKEKLLEKLPKSNYTVLLMSYRDNYHKFNVVVNPYGGVYEDDSTIETPVLKKIMSYVEKGGIWINVADIPMFYTYRRQLNRKVDSHNEARFFINRSPALVSPLLKELGLYAAQIGINKMEQLNKDYLELRSSVDEELNIDYKRFIEIPASGVSSVIKPINIFGKDLTPFFYVSYGDGYFLISLIPFYLQEKPNINKDYKERFISLIAALIHKKLNSLQPKL